MVTVLGIVEAVIAATTLVWLFSRFWHLLKQGEDDYVDDNEFWSSAHSKPLPEGLSLGPRQFRLVRLLKSSTADIVVLETRRFSLDDAPVYTDLSYQWTNAPPEHSIVLNKRAFKVRPNLHDFLKIMQKEHDYGWVFIDAICVNQVSLPERSTQVRMMDEIYRKADHVVAWLGAGGSNNAKMFGAHSSHTAMDEEVYGLLCSSTYWTRLWIIQELLVARDLKLRIADLELEWQALHGYHSSYVTSSFRREAQKSLLPINTAVKGFPVDVSAVDNRAWGQAVVEAVISMRADQDRYMTTPPRRALVEVLYAFGSQRCAEPRDTVFGLLASRRKDEVTYEE